MRLRAKTFLSGLSVLLALVFAVPATAVETNLVANPSMETVGTPSSVPLGWIKGGSGANTRVLTYPVAGFDGGKAAKTEITTYTNGDAKWYFQPIPVSGGQTFVFSDRYTSNVESYLTLQYRLQDGTYKYPDIALHLPAAAAWTQVTRTFTVPTNYVSPVASVTVFHLIKTVGWITTDTYDLHRLDTTAPAVSVDAVTGQPVSAIVNLSATATDDVGVAGVQFYVDGGKAGTEIPSAPFTYAWDTTVIPDGPHSVFAVARDAASNSATSTAIQVDVRNHPSGTLTVTSVVINDNGGTKAAGDFPLFVDARNVVNGAATEIEVGSHVVSEISDPAYTSTISGDCAANGAITLGANTVKQCTIVNDDIPPAPSMPSSNRILNPSVESASTSPTTVPLGWLKGGAGTNTRVLTYPVPGYEGAKAVKTQITAYTNGDAKWYFQPVAASGGQTYTYSDYYTSNVESHLTVQYRLQDGTFKYPDIALHLPPASTWTQVSRTFTVPTNYASPVASVTVFHLIKSVGWIATDAHVLETYVSPPTDPANLVANASFETASGASSTMPAFWTNAVSSGSQATFAYPVAGHLGLAAAKVSVSSYTSGAGAKWYFQSVPVNAGEDYEFSDWYKGDTNSIVTMQFQLDSGAYDYIDLLDLPPASVWTQSHGTFTAPAHAVSMTAIHLIQSVGTLTVDDYSLKQLPSARFAAGMVTLHFDDGLASVYHNAIPMLNAAGIRSSQYIITGTFGWSGYVSASETAAMRDAGHEIGSHTRTHAHLTQLTHAQMVAEVAGAKSDLAALGMDPVTFVYPYGEFNADVEQAVIDAGYRGARSVRTGFNTKNTNPFELEDQHVESDTTAAQIRGWIDQALADRKWLILEIHDVDHSGLQYSTTPEILQDAVNYIASTGIAVVTTSEGLTLMGH